MRQFFRMIAWLALVGGLVVSSLAIMANDGVMPFGIDVFDQGTGPVVNGRQHIVVGVLTALVGAVMLRLTRRNWSKSAGH